MSGSMIFTVAGGVGLFLYGIKLMSEALQFIAGDRMRQLIGALTKTPLRGVFVGILVTILIQSSTGTTVMTVSFVNAGLLTLKQAIGIIMGANVGTTITAQIIALEIERFALPLVALGVGLTLFGRTKKLNYLGNGIVGLGLLFLGMQQMEAAAHAIAAWKGFLLALTRNPFLGVLAGIVLTVVIQSSAATIGLTMALASQGLLTLDAAIPIILGDNIGTTLTAILAAVGASRSAKQAAAAHVLFNLLGVVIFFLALPLYKILIIHSAVDVERQIANTHTIFNVVNTILFFPFIPFLARMIEWLIPSRPDETPQAEDAIYLDHRLIGASTTAAVRAVRNELTHMGKIVEDMLGVARKAYAREGELSSLKETFDAQEKSVNAINRAISAYASEIWQKGVSADISTVLGCYASASGDLERIGDHVENLLELNEMLGDSLSPEAMGEFWTIFDTVEEAVSTALFSLREESVARADRVTLDLERRIDDLEKQYRKKHIDRLNRRECDPVRGVNFIDLLSNLERIGDHSNNIAGYTHDIAALKKA